MSELVVRTLELLAETKDGFVSAVKNIFNTRTMTTLKISDLSVGDWVHHGFYELDMRVITIYGDNKRIIAESSSGYGVTCHLDHFSPIPITAKILEKNGLFRHEFDADNPQEVVLSNYFMLVRTYTDVDWWRVLIYDEEMASRELFNGRVYSVHQLQHALRLAGVDKEINL